MLYIKRNAMKALIRMERPKQGTLEKQKVMACRRSLLSGLERSYVYKGRPKPPSGVTWLGCGDLSNFVVSGLELRIGRRV